MHSMSKIDVYSVWRTDFASLNWRGDGGYKWAAIHRSLFTSLPPRILAKLDWYRQGGEQSDRQWRDVLGVLRVQSNALDRGYLEDWAKQLGLSELLNRATKDAEDL